MNETNKTLAFVFPGQGSQHIGMLKEHAENFPSIQETFKEASIIFGKDLWSLTQNGSTDELNQTVNTQPALLAAGVALWRVWQSKEGQTPSYFAGHSLGEYTALVCAGAISLSDGMRLVCERAKLMQNAVPIGEGAMAAVLGLDDKVLETVCKNAAKGEIVAPANYNAIGQTVISGTKTAIIRVMELAKEKGAKKVVMLPVSVPSHCELMKEAALTLAKVLENVKITSPAIPIISNVDAQISYHPDDIRERLVTQLYCPVRWVESIQRLASEGVKTLVECGPSKVLTALIKRIDSALHPLAIETPALFLTALQTLKT